MNIHTILRLAWKQTQRELKTGQFNLLLMALFLAVAVSTGIGFLSEQLEKGLGRQVAGILGADLVIQGSHPVERNIGRQARALGIDQVNTIEFPSVIVANGQFQMVSAKGVEPGYPLRGELRTAGSPFGKDRLADSVPATGEVWLEPRLFPLLNVEVGDSVQLGEKTLTVSRAITLESDRGKGFYSFSPRLMFNKADLEATGLVQPGSRVAWRNLYAGSDQSMSTFRAWLADHLPPEYRLLDIEEGNRGVSRSLQRVTGFLTLSAQLILLLAGIAMAMAARRFAERRYDGVALLRCLGASSKEAQSIVLLQLLFVLLSALPLALLSGWLLNRGMVWLLADLLPAWMPAPGLKPVVVGAITGFVILLGFALAPLLQLGQVTPLRVLKKDVLPVPVASGIVYLLALTSLIFISWLLSGNVLLTLALSAGVVGVLPTVAVCLLVLYGLFASVLKTSRLPLVWRLALRRLVRHRSLALAQLMAFSLTMMIMVVAYQLQAHLVDRWQEQLPENAPNYFTLNIQPHEKETFADYLGKKAIATSELFPIVRGRLVEINEVAIDQLFDEKGSRDPALNRELNLTWSTSLPEMDRIVEGQWMSSGTDNEVSVETKLAERLGVQLGDWLTFAIAGQTLNVQVTSLRQVEWENFRPNFYMVMPEAALKQFPATWLNSFYLPDGQRQELNEMIQRFPLLTLIDMDTVIDQARVMISQGVVALEVMMTVLLVAGMLVLWGSIMTTRDQRIRESALLRTFGGQSIQLQKIQLAEFVVLGSVSGILAVAGSELCTWLIFTQVMSLSWEPSLWLLLVVPLIGTVLIGVVGYLGSLSVLRAMPIKLLRGG